VDAPARTLFMVFLTGQRFEGHHLVTLRDGIVTQIA